MKRYTKENIGLYAIVDIGISIILIAPNTLVNQGIPDHSIVIGNPCKIVPRENATKQYVIYKV